MEEFPEHIIIYTRPTDQWIDYYEQELVALLKHNAVDYVVYGFQRNGLWTPASVRYHALPGGTLVADDDPGKIRPGIEVGGAAFTSFLSYSLSWLSMPQVARAAVEQTLPFQRSTGSTPGLENGSWVSDVNYSAGGRGLGRSSVRT